MEGLPKWALPLSWISDGSVLEVQLTIGIPEGKQKDVAASGLLPFMGVFGLRFVSSDWWPNEPRMSWRWRSFLQDASTATGTSCLLLYLRLYGSVDEERAFCNVCLSGVI